MLFFIKKKLKSILGIITSMPSMLKYTGWKLESPNNTKNALFIAAGVIKIQE
jgi:hypothetical protein